MGTVEAPSVQEAGESASLAPFQDNDSETLQASVRGQPVIDVPVALLLLENSPRHTREDAEHVQRIAAVDGELPPILVHRPTMQVIDGAHRVKAALSRGDKAIAVRFFDGNADDAFVLAVNSNVTHGLPLSLADREAATTRILATHHWWSDRAIACAVGLSAKKVRALRRSTADGPQSNARLGRDGRVRPIDSSAGRTRVSRIFAERPNATIREVAREAGVSVSTAHDVRERLHRGDDPVLPRRYRAPRSTRTPQEPPANGCQQARNALRDLYQQMGRDPRIRYSEQGRMLLRWLDAHLVEPREWVEVIDAVPEHWTAAVTDLARRCAAEWQEMARELDQRR
jgi:hypothetical protein